MGQGGYSRKVNDTCICGILVDDQVAAAAQDVHIFGSIDAELGAILNERYRSRGAARGGGLVLMLVILLQ